MTDEVDMVLPSDIRGVGENVLMNNGDIGTILNARGTKDSDRFMSTFSDLSFDIIRKKRKINILRI